MDTETASLYLRIAEAYGGKIFGWAAATAHSVADALSLNFAMYFDVMVPKCRNVKTLISRDHPVDLFDIYVPTRFKRGNSSINAQQFRSLAEKRFAAILYGSAGSGKSMFMRYLFLTLVENSTSRIPLFIELRGINALQTKDVDLIQYIYYTVIDRSGNITFEQFSSSLKEGNCVLLLDGFDEIDFDQRSRLQDQIVAMQETHRELSIVISSRPDERFASWSQFTMYHVEAMSESELIKLISKIPYDKEVKKKFAEQIKEGLYKKHGSFLSNPLLATMMLLTFDQFAHVPDKIHIFYEQAFETLFFRHDTSKQAAFQRKRHTDLAINEFRNCLSALCVGTYVKEKFVFTESEALDYLDKALTFERLDCPSRDFLKDLLESSCILQRDGLFITFSHRSFQEYFAAVFVSRFPAVPFADLLDRIVKRGSDSVIPMAFDMNRGLLEREWIAPNIERITSYIEVIEADKNLVAFAKIAIGVIFVEVETVQVLADRDAKKPGMQSARILFYGVRDESPDFHFIACLYRLYPDVFKFSNRSLRDTSKQIKLADQRLKTREPSPTRKSKRGERRRDYTVFLSEEDSSWIGEVSLGTYLTELAAGLNELKPVVRASIGEATQSGVALFD